MTCWHKYHIQCSNKRGNNKQVVEDGGNKSGQVDHIAPLNRLPLLRFRPGGVNRSWSYGTRPRQIYALPQQLKGTVTVF